MAEQAGAPTLGECISLYLLDGFAAEVSGHGRLAIKNRKACGLLAYLALRPNGCETRERLAGLLWSDSSEDQARASLRQCLKQLRGLFDRVGSHALQTERQEVALDLTSVHVDLKQAASRLGSGQVDADLIAGQLDPDHILYGFETLDSAFSAWLHVQRHHWRDSFVEQLQAILRDKGRARHDRKVAGEALVKVDPTHEEAHRFLIAQHADEGNTGAALRQYKILWDLLDEEYDMEPAKETQDLIVRVKDIGSAEPGSFGFSQAKSLGLHEQVGTAETFPEKDVAADKRLVIMLGLFTSEGVDPSKLYIVNGFRHELLASLIRFREWIVLEDQGISPKALHKSIGVSSYLVEATALDAKSRIELVLTVKDRESEYYVWSDRFTLNLDEWFENLEFIVRRIAIALNVKVSADRISNISKKANLSTVLYDRWLWAQELYFQWRPKDSDEAARILESIVADAPDFARAYSSLVQVQNSRHIIFPGIFRTAGRERRSLTLAQKAVQLDPIESRSHLCLAWSNALNGRFDSARFNYELALELNENDPWTLVSAAHGLAFCGQKTVALELADQALQLGLGITPLHWGYQAGIRFICEDYEGCVKAATLANDVIYDMPGWKTAALTHMGRKEEALAEGRHFLSFIRANWYGETAPKDETIAQWLLHCFPFRYKADWERLRSGLSLANVPVPQGEYFKVRNGQQE